MTGIVFKIGDIFESDMTTIVNPCNMIGVAGGGLSLIFKQRYPLAYKQYMIWCKTDIDNGDICFSSVKEEDLETKKMHNVLHFPTKTDWREDSAIQLIEAGLFSFLKINSDVISSIAWPALGCGLGGLEWEDVQSVMIEYLGGLDIPVEIYLPK